MRFYGGIAAVIGWFALGLQLLLILTADSDISVGGRAVNFFSYFTILSNILAALVLTSAWRGGGIFLGRPGVQTAATLYMTITGLVYTFILAGIWAPTGWAFVADALLHYVMPVVVVLFWFLFVRKGTLTTRSIVWMMAFPIVYAAYSLIRGPIVEWYPYPFLDVGDLGGGRVAANIVAMIVAFLVVGAIYLGLDRLLSGRAVVRARS